MNRRRTILILLVLSSITLITLDTRGGDSGVGAKVRNAARDVFAPVQDGVDQIVSPIENWWSGVTRAGSINKENRKLRRELQAEKGRLATAEAAVNEIRALKRLAELPFAADIPGIDAQIVLGSPGNFEATVGLNKGTADGLAVDEPVVSGRGLLGRVARASGQRATVLLLTDRESGVNLRDARTGVLGVLNGRPGSQVQQLDLDANVTDIEHQHQIRAGDLLVTAGSQDGPFPPDIPVARVVDFNRPPGDLLYHVTIRLLADPSTTEYVRVLQWPAPAAP